MKRQDRTVSKRPDGSWANKGSDAQRASSVHRTQKEAIAAARKNLKSEGGGELLVKGRDGKIKSKGTISPRLGVPENHESTLSNGIIPAQIQPGDNPWLALAGTLDPDEPLVQRWKEEMESYRREKDDDPNFP
jgi:hypothetical protein